MRCEYCGTNAKRDSGGDCRNCGAPIPDVNYQNSYHPYFGWGTGLGSIVGYRDTTQLRLGEYTDEL